MKTHLPSTVDNAATEKRVLRAARDRFGRSRKLELTAFFEHGHWWIKTDGDDEDRAKFYNVVDTSDGFDFEPV